jgi:transcriptional regulator with XRE-family HTH domain
MGRSRYKDWFLVDWMTLHDKVQTSLVNELGLSKNTANKLWHGTQPYKRELINQVADWLDIEPYELLLPPSEALAIRDMRESAEKIVRRAREAS